VSSRRLVDVSEGGSLLAAGKGMTDRRTETRIGKFEVIARITRGGMAEVYRCRLRGIGGFEKVVVLKTIRADRSSDPSFVSMFLDEARMAANLNHPNIVQVFEIDEVDGSPYIAMEHVDGATLSLLLREARRTGRVPIGHVVKILADVCEGLHYAHTATSPAGKPLGLVHRDVSPQNIIVSREGVPKLLDFGIAKANGRLTETKVGTVKGRLRYMSPEHLSGKVDHRADVFAVGVCLFEATTGHNPYGATEDGEVAFLERIMAGTQAAPSDLVPDYPPLLEAIVLSAIEPDLSKRCPSARALHDRLEAFLAEGRHPSSTRALAAWVQGLVPSPQPTAPAPTADTLRVATPASPVETMPGTASDVGAPSLATTSPLPLSRSDAAPLALPRRSRARALVVPALLAAAAGSGAWLSGRQRAPEPPAAALAPVARTLASGASGEAAAKAYLEAAEKLVATGRQPLAQDLLDKARALAGPDSALQPRLARLVDTLAAAPSALQPPAAAPVRDRAAPPSRTKTAAASSAAQGRRSGKVRREAPPAPALGLASLSPPAAPPPPVTTALPSPSATPPPPAAPPAAKKDPGAIHSARPLSKVPPPRLPRVYVARGQEDLNRGLRAVEQEAGKAGCSSEFLQGITGILNRTLSGQATAEIYPAAMYYFIVREAGLGSEKKAAAESLARAHASGAVKAFSRFPIDERNTALVSR
jgi:serine/threonine-protein kinase